MSVWQKAEMFIRALFLLVVLVAFTNGKPPAIASTQGLDSRAAVQDVRITEIDNHVKQHEQSDDARVQVIARDLSGLSNSVAEMRGEERGLFAALAILQVLAMLFQGKREKGKS